MNPPPKTAPGAAPRAYSYLRFSTPEQSKGDSLRRQTTLAEGYAKAHGLALDTELTLRDLGVSAFRGANASVGALGAFRRAIDEGLVARGSFLLVENLDRISRQQARKALRILEEICEAGITLVTLSDNKAYTAESLNGFDFMLAWVHFMRGHEESHMKASRLRAAWVGKRERAAAGGAVITIRGPAWLKADGSAAKDARNAKFTLIPERAALIRRMFKLFLAGVGKKAIAQTFNGERIATWGAGLGRKPAKYWHGTYVYKILTSPTVTGVFTPHIDEYRDGRTVRVPQDPLPDYYPRVIDDETYARVQTLMRSRTKTVRRSDIASVVAGLARCPKCGSTMTRIYKGAKDPTPKLVCNKARSRLPGAKRAACTYHSVRLEYIERALIDNASKLGHPPVPDTNLADAVEGVSGEIEELQIQIESLLNTIERSPSEAASKRLAAREAELAKLRQALGEMQTQAADSESRIVKHRAARLADALKQLDGSSERIAAANAALRECVNSVTVDYRSGKLVFSWRHDVTSSLSYGVPEMFAARRATAGVQSRRRSA